MRNTNIGYCILIAGILAVLLSYNLDPTDGNKLYVFKTYINYDGNLQPDPLTYYYMVDEYANTTRFRNSFYTDEQQIQLDLSGIDDRKHCIIRDVKNWICYYGDMSGVEIAKNGIVTTTGLGISAYTGTQITISKFEYYKTMMVYLLTTGGYCKKCNFGAGSWLFD